MTNAYKRGTGRGKSEGRKVNGGRGSLHRGSGFGMPDSRVGQKEGRVLARVCERVDGEGRGAGAVGGLGVLPTDRG